MTTPHDSRLEISKLDYCIQLARKLELIVRYEANFIAIYTPTLNGTP